MRDERDGGVLLATLAVALVALAGCRPAETERQPNPQWVIRAPVRFVARDLQTPREPLPLEAFRPWFPYIAGDLYGSPTTPDIVQPSIGADYVLEVDLNHGHEALLASLERTRFKEGYLRVDPADARIARLATLVLEPDGIERVGWADWVDAATGERLLLMYADRPLTITGDVTGEMGSVRYDISVGEPGYVWLREQLAPQGSMTYTVTDTPVQLALAISPMDGEQGD